MKNEKSNPKIASDISDSGNLISNIIFYGIVAIVFVTPLIFTTLTAEITQIKTTFFQILSLFLSILSAFQTIKRGRLRPNLKQINPLSYVLIGFSFLLCIFYLIISL